MSDLWISETDLRDIFGKDIALAVVRALGGQAFYIPRRAKPDHPLAKIVGLRNMAALCNAFGGERIALPSAGLGASKHGIRAMLAEGASHADVARRFRVTVRYVYAVAAAAREEASADAPTQLSLFP